MLLEECKHVFKEKKMSSYITDDINILFHYSDREDSDEKNVMRKVRYRMYLLFIFYCLKKKNYY